MKRLVLVLALMVVSSFVFADTDVDPAAMLSEQFILNYAYDSQSKSLVMGNRKGSIATERSSVSSNDTAYPLAGSGTDFTGYKQVFIYIDGVKGQSWSLTPLYGDGSAYYAGSSTTMSGDSAAVVDVYGNSDVYFFLDAKTSNAGCDTNTITTLKSQGVNN